jgi:hypothetical protein
MAHRILNRNRRTLLAAAALCGLSLEAMAQGAAPPPPTLVVFMAVDQMRADYLERFGAQLTGGLARLYRNGAVFTNARHDHAITETAPGHSVMLSGRFPRGTGSRQQRAARRRRWAGRVASAVPRYDAHRLAPRQRFSLPRAVGLA